MPLIVHITDFSSRNYWIERQLNFLREGGLEQALISIGNSGPLINHLRQNGFEKVNYIPRSLLGIWDCVSMITEWSNDDEVVVFAHGHLPSVLASAINKFRGVNYVICHHQQPNFFKHYMRISFFRGLLHTLISRFYLKSATRIQSLSEEVYEHLVAKGVSPKKIVEIPFGVNFTKYSKKGNQVLRRLDKEKIRLISVSRLSWEKRIDLGIDVVKKLIDMGVPVEYRIVGVGPENFKLTKQINRLNLNNHVFLLGWQDNVSQEMSNSDIFFHLSLTESYGQVLMEARLSGLRIFSTKSGVVSDMVSRQDPYVYVFDSSDENEVADDLLSYIEDCRGATDLQVFNPCEIYYQHDIEYVLDLTRLMLSETFHLK